MKPRGSTDGPLAPDSGGVPFGAEFLRTLDALGFAVLRMRAREGAGRRLLDRRGGRSEFAGHRPYTPGDDARDIDWSARERTGRLHVKEYDRREDAEVVLALDASRSMEFHGKLAVATRIAWALGWIALATEAPVRAARLAGGDAKSSAPVRGRARIGTLAAGFAGGAAPGGTRLSDSLARLPPPSGAGRIVILLSDLLAEDDGARAVAALAQRGDTVGVIHLVAAADLDVPADAQSVIDAETGERVALGADSADRAALSAARSERTWREFASRRRVRYVRADVSEGAEEIVLRALRRGGVLL